MSLPPVGPEPQVDIMLIGALLRAKTTPAIGVLAHLADDDIESPSAAAVLAAIRALAYAGTDLCPQLVLDELRRNGAAAVPATVGCLRDAVTSGAEPMAARAYAAATVAASLRRRISSAGAALTDIADNGTEADLVPLADRAIETIQNCGRRLAALRGES